ITFSLSGEERPFPLDLVPRVLPAHEWALIEAGVRQRVRALEAFLADVYGPAEVVNDGVIPRRLVSSATHFQREAAGIEPANGVRIHVAGIDLVRDQHGDFRVLEDNLRTPSGISYVVENRRAMTHVFPELFASHRVRPVATYPARLLGALRAAAPESGVDPTVVVLTPGIHNSAYFEHSFLARQMGVELVEGRDLVCLDGVVYMRTTTGERRVDVIYRRIDDDYLDPLHFRPDSILGCPGILNAARAGNVTIANAVGNGVADDKAVYPFVPTLIGYYLNERPLLDNVPTYRLDQPEVLADVLTRLDELVLKPVDGSGGYGLVIGPFASDEELARLRPRVLSHPRGWIAQEVVQLSTSPTHCGDGMAPRHVDLRPFAVNDGHDVWVVPGGLTRVALPADSLVVNSSQGGGSKDTWVLTDAEGRPAATRTRAPERLRVPGAHPPPDPGPSSLQASQQQQQQQEQPQEQPQQC
ncbi:MAG TPA: circularly permuted type 2 ATP-grasp protein, partial [Acidimicrobiales bacterium]|nr:circularly permuted type 2 ATP-grasp protein [Acidimicrobiales bacterium]